LNDQTQSLDVPKPSSHQGGAPTVLHAPHPRNSPAYSRPSHRNIAPSHTAGPGKIKAEGAHVDLLGSERNSGRRNAFTESLLERRCGRPHHLERIRGAYLDKPCEDVWALPKGSIVPGSDADIVIWDPNRKKISGLVCGEL
jgi:hypothetical protein